MPTLLGCGEKIPATLITGRARSEQKASEILCSVLFIFLCFAPSLSLSDMSDTYFHFLIAPCVSGEFVQLRL